MKPDFEDAPEWAKYLAMDDDGSYYWFDSEPELHRGTFYSKSDDGKIMFAGSEKFTPIVEEIKR